MGDRKAATGKGGARGVCMQLIVVKTMSGLSCS